MLMFWKLSWFTLNGNIAQVMTETIALFKNDGVCNNG
jgi:hypothetical protein